jgi:hypothetical protein
VSSDKELMSCAAARVLAEQWPDDRAIVGIEIEDVGALLLPALPGLGTTGRRPRAPDRRAHGGALWDVIGLAWHPFKRLSGARSVPDGSRLGGLPDGAFVGRAPCTGLRARSRSCAAV